MAWIRLSDNYIDHPKFYDLSDGAFRLWHEAMAYCRRHQTDGSFSFTVMRGLRSFTKGREKQLATAVEGHAALWDLVPAMGYRIHDYLDWNPSREEENERRSESKERMRWLREQRRSKGVAPPSVSTNSLLTPPLERSQNVPDMDTDTDHKKGKTSEFLDDRARELMEAYPVWYAQERHGARHKLVGGPLEFIDAKELVSLWEDERLEKLARIFLTTDDQWISTTDRGFRLFAKKAQWADDRLKQWELEQAKARA